MHLRRIIPVIFRYKAKLIYAFFFTSYWNDWVAFDFLFLQPQNLVLTGPFPDCDIKLCDFGISRHIACGADVREILGTPDYVGKWNLTVTIVN